MARTGMPAATSRWVTGAQLPASAKAPWTRTTVGEVGCEGVLVMDLSGSRGARLAGGRALHAASTGARVAYTGWCISGRSASGQRPAELLPAGDLELGVHPVQVRADRAGGEEQLLGDLRVGQPRCGEAGDLQFLGCEPHGRGLRPARPFTGGPQFFPGAFGPG